MIQVLDNMQAGEWIEEHKDDIFKLLEPVLGMYLKAPSNMVRRAMCSPNVFCVVSKDGPNVWLIYLYERQLLQERAGIGMPKAVISSDWFACVADLVYNSGQVSQSTSSWDSLRLRNSIESCRKIEREQHEHTTNPE